MIRRFLLKIAVSIGALWVADYFLGGFAITDGIRGYLLAGLALGALNTFVRPVLKLIAAPLILVTLGLFTLVINAAILWFVSGALDAIVIANLWTLLAATLIMSVVHLIFNPKS